MESTFLAFWQIFGVLMSKSVIFGFKIASEAMQMKIPGAVLSVSVVLTRDYVRLKIMMLQNILNTHIMQSCLQRRSEAVNVFKRPQRYFLHVPDILETFERKKISSHFYPQNYTFFLRREISICCVSGWLHESQGPVKNFLLV